MKRIILFFILLFSAVFIKAQSTYYWTGGLSASWAASTSWNTTLGGGGTARTAPNVADVLIFDGSNIGAGATGNITVTLIQPETIASLRVQNGATVAFNSGIAGTSLSANISRAAPVVYGPAGNTTTITSNVVGMTSTTGINVGAIITAVGATSIPTAVNVVTAVAPNTSITVSQPATVTTTGTASFTISQPLNFSTSPAVVLSVGDFVYTGTASNIEQITSIVDGQNVFTTTGTAAITAAAGFKANPLILTSTTNALSVANGCTLTLSSSTAFILKLASGAKGSIDGTLTSASGNLNSRIIVDADGTASLTFKSGSILNGGAVPSLFGAVANANNNNVIFESGSIVNYSASVGTNGIFGAMYPASIVKFQKGSTFAWSGTATGFTSGTNRELPNLKFNVSVTSFGPPVVDTLIIPAGISVGTTSGSYMALKGDLINDGTLAFNSNLAGLNFLLVGTVPQRVLLNGTSGGGTVTYTTTTPNTGGSFQKIIVAPNSVLNVQPSTVDFNTYGVTSVYGTLNFGTNVIKNVNTALTGAFSPKPSNTSVGSTTLVVAASNSYNLIVNSLTGFVQGMILNGPGIPANTVIINTATGNIINTSNPVTLAAGSTITSSVNPVGGTVTTANTAGLAASYTIQGTSTFSLGSSPGANYRFDAATTTPFPSTLTSVNANNLTLAANVSSNVTVLSVNGTLDLGSNTLTVPVADTVKITSGNAVLGSSATKFISLGVNSTTGARGFLRMGNLATTTLFPIGCNGNYLPVTITPAASNEDYSIAAFNGATVDATPNGTAITAAQKATVVDAVWNITSNYTPTNNSSIQLGWPAILEGSSFTGYVNSEIGIAPFTTHWGVFAGSGNNTTNVATNSFNAFSSFSVGKVGLTLPVKFSNINASLQSNHQAKITWQIATEINVDRYIVEASKDGTSFTEKGSVKAIGINQYSFVDLSLFNGTNYYRIKAIDKSGAFILSSVVVLNTNKNAGEGFSIYPNPVKNNNMNIVLNESFAAKYSLLITDMAGKSVYTTSINHSGGMNAYSIPLPTNMSKGIYVVKLLSATGIVSTKNIIVE